MTTLLHSVGCLFSPCLFFPVPEMERGREREKEEKLREREKEEDIMFGLKRLVIMFYKE